MNKETQELFNEMVYGVKKDIYLDFLGLMVETTKYVDECIKHDDEPNMSEEFLEFLIFINNLKRESNETLEQALEASNVMQTIFNEGLDAYSNTTLLNSMPKEMRDKLLEVIKESEEPLSALELIATERLEVLFNTHINFKELFLNLPNLTITTWDEFKALL